MLRMVTDHMQDGDSTKREGQWYEWDSGAPCQQSNSTFFFYILCLLLAFMLFISEWGFICIKKWSEFNPNCSKKKKRIVLML